MFMDDSLCACIFRADPLVLNSSLTCSSPEKTIFLPLKISYLPSVLCMVSLPQVI